MTLDIPAEPALLPQGNGNGATSDPASLSCGSRWFCCATHPKQEDRACRELANQFEASYLSLTIEQRNVGRIVVGRRPSWRPTVATGTPLFPGYVFVRFDPDRDAWGACRSTRGVLALIRHALDKPTPLPIGVIESLQARTSARGIVDDPDDMDTPEAPEIPLGAAVRVVDGPISDDGAFHPFAGLEGIVDMSSAARCHVLIALLGRHVSVSVETRHLTVS